jgi:hypothetical protein
VVVRHQITEALGDAAQFESQRNLLTSVAGDLPAMEQAAA